jgi:hypothetical protein
MFRRMAGFKQRRVMGRVAEWRIRMRVGWALVLRQEASRRGLALVDHYLLGFLRVCRRVFRAGYQRVSRLDFQVVSPAGSLPVDLGV